MSDDLARISKPANAVLWPVVQPDDDGIRPAGKPDECFYCHQKVGTQHAQECVTVSKLVRLKYTFEVDVRVPHFWEPHTIEFHRNESSWCADNAVDEIADDDEKTRGDDGCWCDRFTAQFVKVIDDTPTSEPREGLKETP